jgi:hypothetical protein
MKGKPNPNGSPNCPVRIAHGRRAGEALELRLAGLSYAAIGERMGVSAPRAYQLVSGEVERINARRSENAAELVRIEVERLDRLLEAVWPKATAGELAAVDRVLLIMARQAKLLGLDADRGGPSVLVSQSVGVGGGAGVVFSEEEKISAVRNLLMAAGLGQHLAGAGEAEDALAPGNGPDGVVIDEGPDASLPALGDHEAPVSSNGHGHGRLPCGRELPSSQETEDGDDAPLFG